MFPLTHMEHVHRGKIWFPNVETVGKLTEDCLAHQAIPVTGSQTSESCLGTICGSAVPRSHFHEVSKGKKTAFR